MSKTAMKRIPYIWTFPIVGLQLTEARLVKPMRWTFQDATIVSEKQLRLLLKGKSWIIAGGYESVVQMALRNRPNTDSLLLVRRDSLPSKEKLQEAETQSAARAKTIASLLTVYLATRSGLTQYCGLANDLTFPWVDYFGFSLDLEKCKFRRTWLGKLNTLGYKTTTSKLIRDLRHGDFLALTRIIIDSDSHFSTDVAESIERACARLAAGMYTHASEDYVLSVVTAAEILLVEDDGKEANIQGRMKALFNSTYFDDQIQALFNARNNWAHRGAKVPDEFAKIALSIGISCLICYAQLAAELPKRTRKKTIIAYLDLAKHRFDEEVLNSLFEQSTRDLQRRKISEKKRR